MASVDRYESGVTRRFDLRRGGANRGKSAEFGVAVALPTGFAVG